MAFGSDSMRRRSLMSYEVPNSTGGLGAPAALEDPRSTYARLYQIAADTAVVDTHDHLRPIADFGETMTVRELLLHTYVSKCIRLPDGSPNGIGNQYEEIPTGGYPAFVEIARRASMSSYFVWLMRGLAELYDLPGPITGEAAYEKLEVELPLRYRDESWICLLYTSPSP